MLDINFIPQQNRVAIDAGNPDGVTASTDLAGNDRIQGLQIDAGAFESPFSTPIIELENNNLQVYPNPFVDYIVLSDLEGINAITLLDGSGKEISHFPILKNIFISNELPVGIYFLEITIEKKKFLKKIKKISR